MPATRVLVITVSDRAVSGAREDRSGPLLVDLFQAAGYDVSGPRVVTDGVDPVSAGLEAGIAEGFGLVVTSGGTGVSPRDFTPEATRRFVTRELLGLPSTCGGKVHGIRPWPHSPEASSASQTHLTPTGSGRCW